MNPQRGMIAVDVGGFFTIIELLGDEVEIGEVLSWDGYIEGGGTCLNRTRGHQMSVYFQNHDVPMSQLRQQLLIG